MSSITLAGSQRSALLNLQETARLSQRTTLRLSTGRAVNSIADNAVNFFRSRSLENRATDFEDRKNDISQGISSINTALEGTDAIDSLLKQLRGIVEGSRSGTQTERRGATTQFYDVLNQIGQLVEDTSYQGLNLLNNSNSYLSIRFSERSNATLLVKGYGLTSDSSSSNLSNRLFTNIAGGVLYNSHGAVVGSADTITQTRTIVINNVSTVYSTGDLARSVAFHALGYDQFKAGGFTNIGPNSSNVSKLDGLVHTIDAAIAKNRAISTELGNNASILQTRLEFTNRYISRLKTGADSLILADLNEEGANLLSLQTRQQLGINALSLASQAQQAILQIVK